MVNRKRTQRLFALLAMLALLTPIIAACGGSPATNTAAPAATTGTNQTSPTVSATSAGTSSTQAPGATATTGAQGGNTANNCADSPAAKLIQETAKLDPKAREEALVKRAAEEEDGVINLYGELGLEEAAPVIDAFEEKYEDLTVSLWRAPSDAVRQRVLEESDANFSSGVDLIELEALEMVILDQKGLLTPASSPLAKDVEKAGQFKNFTADRFSYIVPAWNTKKVPGGDVPKTFEELADPKYKGRLAIEDSDVYWFAVLVKHFQETKGITEEQAIDMFRKLAANSTVVHGHTVLAELLAAGQHGISPNLYVHRIETLKKKKAPVEWKPAVQPVVAEVTAVAVACSAKHPAGALLLQDFFLSPEGAQKVFVENDRTPSNAALGTKLLGDINPISGDVEAIVNEYDKWKTLWDEVLKGGKS